MQFIGVLRHDPVPELGQDHLAGARKRRQKLHAGLTHRTANRNELSVIPAHTSSGNLGSVAVVSEALEQRVSERIPALSDSPTVSRAKNNFVASRNSTDEGVFADVAHVVRERIAALKGLRNKILNHRYLQPPQKYFRLHSPERTSGLYSWRSEFRWNANW